MRKTISTFLLVSALAIGAHVTPVTAQDDPIGVPHTYNSVLPDVNLVPLSKNLSQNEAKDIIKAIVDVVGLKANFEIKPSNVKNACAVLSKGKRYILYNPQFISRINKNANTDWAAISVLAHEIGHHLNGHTLSGKGSSPADELEADEFSGFILRKLGASLEETQAALSITKNIKGSATHPPKNSRMSAIAQGWHSADEQLATGQPQDRKSEEMNIVTLGNSKKVSSLKKGL